MVHRNKERILGLGGVMLLLFSIVMSVITPFVSKEVLAKEGNELKDRYEKTISNIVGTSEDGVYVSRNGLTFSGEGVVLTDNGRLKITKELNIANTTNREMSLITRGGGEGSSILLEDNNNIQVNYLDTEIGEVQEDTAQKSRYVYKQGQESYLEISGNSSVQLEVTGEIELGVYISDEEKEGLERTLGDYSKEELNEIGIDETSQKLLNREVVSQEGTEAINSQRSVSNDKLELFTELNNNDIIDGTPDFDDNDEPGNDSGASNGIVRSFDTITYPLKMTVNSKTGNTINNIKVEISGELENGVYKDRVQAVFSEGANKEPLKDGKSTFKTEYTIPATGNAITFPLTVEVLGAFNGINLTVKNLKVNVISMNGEAVEGLQDEITDVKSIKTSSKVNIGVNQSVTLGGGNGAYGFARALIEEYKENEGEVRYLKPLAYSFFAIPLDGKSTMKGSSFPAGKIKFNTKIEESINWDKSGLDEKLENEENYLFDYMYLNNNEKNVNSTKSISGNELTYSKEHNVTYSYPMLRYGSTIATSKQGYGEKGLDNDYVVDSGKLNAISVTKNTFGYELFNYKIGSIFPTHGAQQNVGVQYTSNQKAFASFQTVFLLNNRYTIGGTMNTTGLSNTMYWRFVTTITSYEDENGKEHEINYTNSIDYSKRNTAGYLSNNTAFAKIGNIHNSDYQWGTFSQNDSSIPYGDGMVTDGTFTKVNCVNNYAGDKLLYGGAKFGIVWNPDSFEYQKELKDNDITGRYRNVTGRSIGFSEKDENKNIDFYWGVKKNSDYSFKAFQQLNFSDFDWYKTDLEAKKSGKISAVMVDTTIPLGNGAVSSLNMPKLKTIANNLNSSVNSEGTPNICVGLFEGYLDEERKQSLNVVDFQKLNDYTKWNKDGEIEKLQSPRGNPCRFDTLGITEAMVRTEINSNKSTYYSTDEQEFTIKNSAVTPESVVEDTDAKITVTIPKGLLVNEDSVTYDGKKVKADIVKGDNGETILEYTAKYKFGENLKDLTYKTMVNPLEIDFVNGITALNTKVVISSPADSSIEKVRTSECTINITKVGQLGIVQEINKPKLEVGEEFKVSINPYTTSEKESRFTGIWKLPETNDEIGNKFNGTLEMKEIEAFGKEIEIYVSKDKVTETNPNKIEGNNQIKLEKYVKGQSLSGYKTVFYKLKEDLLGNDKETSVQITLQPSNNVGGNVYRFITYGNSASDYKVEAESNRVGTTVYERKVNGYAWLGKKDTGIYVKDKDYLLDNISVKLFKKGSEGYKEVSGKTTKTNVNGYYELNNLQSGEYAVGFKEADISKYKLQKALVGEDSSVNSKVSGNDKVDGYVLTEEFTLPDIVNMEEALYIQPYENIGVYGIPSVVISKQVLNEENEDILGKEVETNSTIRYKLNYQNTVENSFVENAVISDTLVEHLSYKGNMKIDGVAVDESKVKVTGQKIEVQVGDIEDTKTHSIVFDVEVGREIAEIFENEFTLTSKNLEEVVSNKVENSVSPNPELLKEVDKEKVKIGEDLEYIITVKNKENSGVWNQVVLKDIFVDSQNQEVDIESFEKAVIRKGDTDENWDKTEVEYNEDNTTYSVNIGDLYEGDVVKVRFKAKVKNYSERYINEAIAEGINGTSNRDDTEVLSDYETPVMPVIVKQGNKEKVSVGEGVVYNVRVGNDGVDTWRGVKVRDNYDSGMDYKDGTLKVYREKDGVKELDEELSKDGDSYVDKKNREILVEVGDIKNDEVVELEYELQAIEEREKYDNVAVGEGINGISKLVEVAVVQQEEEDISEETEGYEQSSLGTEEKNNREQANLPKTSNELSGISIVVFSIITLFCGVVSVGRTKKE